jgi:hypothetical protein
MPKQKRKMAKSVVNQLSKSGGKTVQYSRGTRTIYHSRSKSVDFIKGKGGFYGVRLVIDPEWAKLLVTGIHKSLKAAEKAGINEVALEAHWGMFIADKGYKLDVRVHI